MNSNTRDEMRKKILAMKEKTEEWTCPYPDKNGEYNQCDYKGGIPIVEPNSTRTISCIPCMINRVAKNTENNEFSKHLMSEIHELNNNIIQLAGQISGLKKHMADVRSRVVWVQQKMGLRKMP